MWCGEAHKTLSASPMCVGRDKHHSRSLPTFLSLEITYFLDKLNNHFLELLLSQLVSACAGRSPNSSTSHQGSQGGTSTMPDWRLSCTVRQKGWTTALQMFSVPPLKDKWSLGCDCLRRALVKHQLISSCSKVRQRLPCHSGCLSCLLSLLTGHGSAGASHQCTGELSSFHPCLPSHCAAIPPLSPGMFLILHLIYWWCRLSPCQHGCDRPRGSAEATSQGFLLQVQLSGTSQGKGHIHLLCGPYLSVAKQNQNCESHASNTPPWALKYSSQNSSSLR